MRLRTFELRFFVAPLLLAACAVDDPSPLRLRQASEPASEGPEAVAHDPGSPAPGGALTFEGSQGSSQDPQLAFGPCTGAYAAADDCATARVPLDWNDPGGKTIPLFIAHRRAATANAPQLWLLQGGPGGASPAMIGFMDLIRGLDPNVELFTLDHRGVGRSGRLGCSRAEAATSEQGDTLAPGEVADCAAELRATWGDDVRQLTTTNAARDVAAAVQAFRKPGHGAFVYGVSYGTYWAHRVMQIAPRVADGFILDSIVPAVGQTFAEFELQADPAARRHAAICAQQPECRSRLGPDPWSTIKSTLATLDGTRCAKELQATGEDLRAFFSSALQSSIVARYIPALVHRFKRCGDADVLALRLFFQRLFGPASGPASPPAPPVELLDSKALQNTVALSELWPSPPPTEQELVQTLERLVLRTGYTLSFQRTYPVWPRYAPDAYHHRFATPEVPLLMLNGDLDVQTSIETARIAGVALGGPRSLFVRVPYANHGVLSESAVIGGGAPCGLQLVLGFLGSPRGAHDLSCVDRTAPPAYDGDPDTNRYVFGSPSAWDGGGQATGNFVEEREPAGLEEARRVVRGGPRLGRSRAPLR